jgi:hypothetical protein
VDEYRRRFEREFLNWSSWDKDKIVSALTHSCLQDWSKPSKIEVCWTEMDLQANPPRPQSLILWVSSSVNDADFICSHVGRYRRENPRTIQLAYLNNSCFHRATVLIQSGIHVVVHPLQELPKALEGLLPKLSLISQPSSVLLEGIVSKLPWSEEQPSSSHFRCG